MVGVTEHSLWASMLGQMDSVQLHARLAAGNGMAWVLLLLELALLGLYGRRATRILPEIQQLGEGAD